LKSCPMILKFCIDIFRLKRGHFEILHGLLNYKNISIPINNKKFREPPTPRTVIFLGGKGGYFEKLS
jgi:hypothetical protein